MFTFKIDQKQLKYRPFTFSPSPSWESSELQESGWGGIMWSFFLLPDTFWGNFGSNILNYFINPPIRSVFVILQNRTFQSLEAGGWGWASPDSRCQLPSPPPRVSDQRRAFWKPRAAAPLGRAALVFKWILQLTSAAQRASLGAAGKLFSPPNCRNSFIHRCFFSRR